MASPRSIGTSGARHRQAAASSRWGPDTSSTVGWPAPGTDERRNIDARWKEPYGDRLNEVVFIGRNMDRAAIEEALEQPWDEVMFDFGEIAVSGERFVEAARLARVSSWCMPRRGLRGNIAQSSDEHVTGPTGGARRTLGVRPIREVTLE